jgi:autotransporter-associated beta strand protein
MKTCAAFRTASSLARVGLANGRSLLTLLVVAGVAMPAAQAQTTWLGGGANGNWSTGDNWSSAVNNNFSGGLVFAGSSQTSTNNDRTGVTATTLTFAAGAAPFTISGSQFTLSGAAGALTNSSGTTQTINANMDVTVSGNSVKNIGLTGDIVINGVLSSGTSIALNPTAGNGTLFLNGNNQNFLGEVRIQSGRNLVLGHDNAAGVGTLNWLGNGTLNVTSGSSFTSSANLGLSTTGLPFVGSGNLAFTGTTSFSGTAARGLNVQSGTFTLNTVSGANTTVRFDKSGAGTLVLNGPVSTIAATNVSAGTLFVNGNFSSLTTGTVAAAATLGGNGTISGTMRMNGTLTPGSTGGNVGLLTVNDLILSSTSRTLIDINGSGRGTGFDAVTASAGLTYSGTLAFTMPTLLTGTFNVFDFASTTGNLNTVSGLFGAQSVSFTNSGGVWTAPLTNGTATFTQSTGELVIVPEPATIALAGLGLGCVGFAAWRRRGGRRQTR